MEHWFSAWNKLYQDLEQKWSMISEQEQNSQLQLLEKSTEAVLDVWGKMDEQLALLKEKNVRQAATGRLSLCWDDLLST